MSAPLLAFYNEEASLKYKIMMESEDELKFYRKDMTEMIDLLKTAELSTIVDVGCGTACLLNLVAQVDNSLSLVGVDCCETMLVHARALVPSASFSIGDATKLDIESDSVGGLICSFVSHHLSNEELKDAVSEFARVLAPGGHLYHCYWHGEGNMEYSHHDEAAVMPTLVKRMADDVVPLFESFGLTNVKQRIESYVWGVMCFELYKKYR